MSATSLASCACLYRNLSDFMVIRSHAFIHVAVRVELVVQLAAGVRQRGGSAGRGDENGSSAQTFHLSPEVQKRRPSPAAP